MNGKTTYRDSGVDIAKADSLIERLKGRIHKTFHPHVLSSIGGFAALTEIPKTYKDPVLVSSTDGVGTKLRVAFMTGVHDTVGIDLVAMSANDVLTTGAKPFFFLDYYAAGSIDEVVYPAVLNGICAGCEMAGCALIGGETAEMPSFYKEGEYELAGFIVGLIEKGNVIDGSAIERGDAVIGLASNGLHSNGYSLARKVLFDIQGLAVDSRVEGLETSVGTELLRPTRIYVKPVLEVVSNFPVRGMAHITGGGLPGNISRIIPDGLSASLDLPPGTVAPIFKVLKKLGNIPEDDMYSTFNMGVGFVLVVPDNISQEVVARLSSLGERAFIIGRIEMCDDARKVTVRSDDTF
ncbi:MAG TPA: phosphoribosylformylglycinamidine cyclo-ligase [Deltaproteobacteria bacterium]|nr:phosphoribosylformylglycinamidine cyclo-ligase [Deltaproteobacteria bacterium]